MKNKKGKLQLHFHSTSNTGASEESKISGNLAGWEREMRTTFFIKCLEHI